MLVKQLSIMHIKTRLSARFVIVIHVRLDEINLETFVLGKPRYAYNQYTSTNM